MTAPAETDRVPPDLETTLGVLDAVADRWVPGGYAGRYADALERAAGYMASDARDEATHVEAVMRPALLGPFLRPDASAPTRATRSDTEESGVFVLGSGNVGIPLILNLAIGLAAGRTLYARASRANAEAIGVWLEALRDPQGRMRGSVESARKALLDRLNLLRMAHDDPNYGTRLASLPVSSAFLWGGAEAIESTAAALRQVATRNVHHFGPRTGVLVLESAFWRARDPAERRAIAQACYDNLVKFDAGLCSSPTLGVAMGEPAECRTMLDELAAGMCPAPDEAQRLARLAGANLHRRRMAQWVGQGYSLHRPAQGATLLALGTLADYQRKNLYQPPAGTFHESAGSLEIVAFEPSEIGRAAQLLAGLQNEPRYSGDLWSIGHVIAVAGERTTAALLGALDPALASAKGTHVLGARDLRVVDIRANLGRQPGERFDGIALFDAMLAA